MTKTVIVVESPAKAKTIKKYLGKNYEVLATYGHVRDLVAKDGAVEPDNGFVMHYQAVERNEKHVKAIGLALKKADQLFLATDPDREGEAIAWHLAEQLSELGFVDSKPMKRVVFHEITRPAIEQAMGKPGEISQALVNAQQARRALDFLVGFNISPLLWRKVQPGLSAGRVQSPALRLIVEREEEIEKFVRQEYWTIDAAVTAGNDPFTARLIRFQNNKVEQFSFTEESTATAARDHLLAVGGEGLVVREREEKLRRRNPPAPFITSTLQQEGVRKLRFGTQRVMRIAQQLYEGVEIDGELTGLISYMRTDSVNLASEALADIRQVAARLYGSKSIPDAPRQFKTSTKNAQEAHEAVRPTSAARTPETVKKFLSEDQFRLYELIWRRAVASQMQFATFEQVAFNLAAGPDNVFRATGSTLVEPGFLAVYREGRDDETDDDNDKLLPALKNGDTVHLKDILSEQHFTEPPPRYTEATLVKTLEEYGIGRPSTYANIISTLINREYVQLENRSFHPSAVGRIVNSFLTRHFAEYVDYDFTADLEDNLDAVSRGEKDWIPLMVDFWGPFKCQLDAKRDIPREEVAQARQLGSDPKSGKPVSVRIGRYGPFVQIGTKDDDEKPRFAGLRQGQRMEEITLEQALELFKLPRTLGQAIEGGDISVNAGRFGPYLRYNEKFVSLGDEDPYTITLERALQLIAEKQVADKAKMLRSFPGSEVRILAGRWGSYITDGNKNAKIPKDRLLESFSLEEAIEALAQAPDRKPRPQGRKGGRRKTTPKR